MPLASSGAGRMARHRAVTSVPWGGALHRKAATSVVQQLREPLQAAATRPQPGIPAESRASSVTAATYWSPRWRSSTLTSWAPASSGVLGQIV